MRSTNGHVQTNNLSKIESVYFYDMHFISVSKRALVDLGFYLALSAIFCIGFCSVTLTYIYIYYSPADQSGFINLRNTLQCNQSLLRVFCFVIWVYTTSVLFLTCEIHYFIILYCARSALTFGCMTHHYTLKTIKLIIFCVINV